jgi:hypothetical protein
MECMNTHPKKIIRGIFGWLERLENSHVGNLESRCWIHVSEAVDEEAVNEETTDVEADMSFSFNKTLAIWICQFLLGLI